MIHLCTFTEQIRDYLQLMKEQPHRTKEYAQEIEKITYMLDGAFYLAEQENKQHNNQTNKITSYLNGLGLNETDVDLIGYDIGLKKQNGGWSIDQYLQIAEQAQLMLSDKELENYMMYLYKKNADV